ncbi:hypothetical protein AM274_26105 [Pseudomonas nunensis]|nr:hypothetical protein AM274_26105 [Pseudomonas nunensis]
MGRLAGRLRGQASLLQIDRVHSGGLVGCQDAFAGKPAPTVLIEYIREGLVGCQAAFAGKPRSYKLIECIREGLVG